MSTFNPKKGIVGKPVKWETPYFAKNFFTFITRIEKEKPFKANNPFK